MKISYKSDTPVPEIYGFHGSGKTDPYKIIKSKEGFDIKFCKPGNHGKGLYFAKEFEYSGGNNSKYCHLNTEGKKSIFISKVITGNHLTLNKDKGAKFSVNKPQNADASKRRNILKAIISEAKTNSCTIR